MALSESLLEGAADAVREWRAVRGWPAPRLPRAEPVRVRMIHLHTRFEARSLRYDYQPIEPTGGFLPTTPASLDPWSVPLEVPGDGEERSAEHPQEERSEPLRCPMCTGSGGHHCDECEGSGQKKEMRHDPVTGTSYMVQFTCGICAGAGNVRCDTCKARGTVMATPLLVIRTGTLLTKKALHDGSVPEEIAEELATGALVGAAKVHEEEAERLTPRAPGSAAKARISEQVEAALAELLAAPLPEGHRARGHALLIEEGHIARFRLPDRELYVYGDPVRVAGDDEPPTSSKGRWVGIGLALAAVGAGLAWWLSQ